MANRTTVTYDGTDYGLIYLRDCGQRNQLGGGKGIFVLGQDQYLAHGSDATLVNTGDVLMSRYDASGVIKHFADAGAFTVGDA